MIQTQIERHIKKSATLQCYFSPKVTQETLIEEDDINDGDAFLLMKAGALYLGFRTNNES